MNSGETYQYDFPLHSSWMVAWKVIKRHLWAYQRKGCAGSDLTMCVRPWSRLDTKVGVQTVTGPGTDRVQAPFRSFIPEAF